VRILGNIVFDYQTDCGNLPGEYTVWVVENNTQRISNTVKIHLDYHGSTCDVEPPTLVDTDPAIDVVVLQNTSLISFTFNEPMLARYKIVWSPEGYVSAIGEWNTEKTTIIFEVVNNLPYDTTFSWILYGGSDGFTDLSGNFLEPSLISGGFRTELNPSDLDDDEDGYTENEGDCNDTDATIYPGAPEICGDGIDQDCAGGDLECPTDTDGDGIPDVTDDDDDNDGMPDWWENTYGLNPLVDDRYGDLDNDGYSNIEEYEGNSDPNDPNSMPAIDLSRGLVAYYPFNGNANDESGNGNHGTVYGATLTADRFGNPNKAYSFDGTTNFIRIEASGTNSSFNEITIAAWVRPTGCAAGLGGIVTRWNQSAVYGNYYGFWYDCTQSPNSIQAGSHEHYMPSTALYGAMGLGAWNLVTYVISPTLGNESLYINGSLVSQKVSSENIRTSDLPIIVGGDILTYQQEDYYRFFQGDIDEVRIYNRALSEVEIQELHSLDVVSSNMQPIRYDTSNGNSWPLFFETPIYTYWDDSYTGSGNKTVDNDPLTGGLGDLTDGIVPTESYHAYQPTNGSSSEPYVGWESINPTVTFYFPSVASFKRVNIWFDDCDGLDGVYSPIGVIINGTHYSVEDPSGTGPFLASFDVSSLPPTDALSITLLRVSGGWVFASEFNFESF